jgi:hypothetical protein
MPAIKVFFLSQRHGGAKKKIKTLRSLRLCVKYNCGGITFNWINDRRPER